MLVSLLYVWDVTDRNGFPRMELHNREEAGFMVDQIA
jgi:hypothetical protein